MYFVAAINRQGRKDLLRICGCDLNVQRNLDGLGLHVIYLLAGLLDCMILRDMAILLWIVMGTFCFVRIGWQLGASSMGIGKFGVSFVVRSDCRCWSSERVGRAFCC